MRAHRRHHRNESERAPEADHAALARQGDLLPQHGRVQRGLVLELELDRVDLRVRADAVERVLRGERTGGGEEAEREEAEEADPPVSPSPPSTHDAP